MFSSGLIVLLAFVLVDAVWFVCSGDLVVLMAVGDWFVSGYVLWWCLVLVLYFGLVGFWFWRSFRFGWFLCSFVV